MIWADFQPYVMPYVIGCPLPVMEHHARLAAIEFCRRTAALSTTLDYELTNGSTTDVDLAPGVGLQILKVHDVSVDGQPWTLATSEHGAELAAFGCLDDFAYLSGLSAIDIYPLQPAGRKVTVRAVVAPSMAASTCPDELLAYVSDIAWGAISSIMMIPAQTFSSPTHARELRAAFDARVATTAGAVSRGLSRAKMRSKATFL
jgi:hypothetical protein